MRQFFTVMRREFLGYFATPLALVFMSVFLLAGAAACFYLGGFFDLGQAELGAFFRFLPWLYLFFLPALTMRLWAEERRLGTWDLLLSLPVRTSTLVLAKFCAAWGLAILTLALSVPLWLSISWLGEPDHGAVAAAYLGSALLAGTYIAIGVCLSASTRNQLIAFIITVAVCFMFLLAGLGFVLDAVKDWVSAPVLETLASFSLLPHYYGFLKGVVEARAVVFLVSLMVVWLAAALVAVERQRYRGVRRKGKVPIATAPFAAWGLLAAIFLFANVLGTLALRGQRLDWTEHNLYTLSDGTRAILSELQEPIELQFFFSQKQASQLPWLAHYARRVRDLLEEMSAQSNGQLTLKQIAPDAFSEQEDEALALGLRSQNNSEGGKIYFGLAGSNAVEQIEVIAFFAPERETYLEYDITHLIYNLDHPDRPVLGVLSNLPLDTGSGGIMEAMEGRSEPFMIYRELADRFDVQFLSQDIAQMPSDIDVVLLAHPRPLSDATQYALDQFALSGGRVLVFVDPYSEVSRTAGPNGQPLAGATTESELERLLAAWGVRMDGTQLVADKIRALRVQSGPAERRTLSDYVVWVGLTDAEMNDNEVVTASLDRLNLASVGALEFTDLEGVQFTPLVTSSRQAGLMALDFVRQQPAPSALRERYRPSSDAPFVIAARLSGEVATAFPDGAPPLPADAPAGTEREPHLARSQSPLNVIVFADSDVFDDRMWVQVRRFGNQQFTVPLADNARFLLNAVEMLTGSDALIGLRGREPSERPFLRIEALRKQAEERYLAEESAIYRRLAEVQAALKEIEDEPSALTPETSALSEQYRTELVQARKNLRAVQKALRQDIESLKRWLVAGNMLAMPTLLLAVWFAVPLVRTGLLRRRQRKGARAA